MNLFVELMKFINQRMKRSHFRATVTGTVGNLVTIQRPGQASADTKSYPKLSSYTPSVSDEVLVVELGASYVVVGKISR